ncbi:MAG: MFS transporter [Myxococcales bacterium]|nr:MAG: MFS transporter [Myxococcales bacterium]
MMVMPLGPDFAVALGIPTSHIGVVGGSYTAAAAIAGVVGSLFLDRFDRRLALGVAMLGLVVGTALGGFATGLGSLLLARIVAGAFGGPATSLSLAVIADAVPPARRGKAMGAVMGAFSIASVLGVPAGLELSGRYGWRAPFFAVAGLGLLLAMGAIWLMPSMREHIRARPAAGAPKVQLLDSVTSISLVNTALIMIGLFAVVPNISAFVQHNMGYPRERIGLLYLVGGVASFVVMRIVGRLVDRYGATPLVVLGTALHAVALVTAFVYRIPWLPVLAVFVVFMLSGSVRMVPMQTLASRVPRPEQRARFMSAQSAVQHAASALGAVLASLVLVAAPDGKLLHMDQVALAALVVACLVPFGAGLLERRVNARQLPVAK